MTLQPLGGKRSVYGPCRKDVTIFRAGLLGRVGRAVEVGGRTPGQRPVRHKTEHEPGKMLSVVTAGPAAAQTRVKFCLTNSSAWCMSISFVQAGEAVEMQVNEVSNPAWTWTLVSEGTSTVNGQQWPSFEIQDSISPTYCLQNTTLSGSNSQGSDLASCSANGTVWIQVKDSNGYYLVSRYALRTNGNEIVLGGILQQDSALLGLAPPPSGPLFEQWTAFAG